MLSVKGGIALVSFMIYLGAINDTYIANVGAVWNLTAGHDRPPGRTLGRHPCTNALLLPTCGQVGLH